MIKEGNYQNISHKAFTLIEMIIVLIIMGIMLMLTVALSGQQIQKVRDKSVKESILAEMQTRYSRNLGSSSFAGKMYNTMNVELTQGKNEINFKYDVIKNQSSDEDIENTFKDYFEIKYITFDYNNSSSNGENSVNIEYSPYKISCKIGDNEDKVIFVTRVNNNRDYCFEIKQSNCRLTEITQEECNKITNKLNK